jgi:hypothetical protein
LAWRARVDAKKRLESGRTSQAKSLHVGEYFQEWLEAVRSNLKDDYSEVQRRDLDERHSFDRLEMPGRPIGPVTLNALYRELRDFGRRKGTAQPNFFILR